MKTKLFYLMLAVFCLSLAACSKDEDNEPESDEFLVGTWEPTHIKGSIHYKWENTDTTWVFDKDIKAGEHIEFKHESGALSMTLSSAEFLADHTCTIDGKKQDGYTWSYKKGTVTMIYQKGQEKEERSLKVKNSTTLVSSLDGEGGDKGIYEKYDVTFTKKK